VPSALVTTGLICKSGRVQAEYEDSLTAELAEPANSLYREVASLPLEAEQ